MNEIEIQIHKEKLNKFKKGILMGFLVTIMLVAVSYGMTYLLNNTDNPISNNPSDNDIPSDNNPTQENSFLRLLASEIDENYGNITSMLIYQNITRGDYIISLDAKFKKINDTDWDMSFIVYKIPKDNLGEIELIDPPNSDISDSDIKEINGLLVSAINNSIQVNVTDDWDNYSPYVASLYIQVLYADNTGLMFHWNDHPEDPVFIYSELTWSEVGDDYVEIDYDWDSQKALSPSSVFDPLLVKLEELFPEY